MAISSSVLLCALLLGQEPNRAVIRGRFVDARGDGVRGIEILHRVWPGAEFRDQGSADGSFQTTISWEQDHRDTWYECTARAFGCARWQYRGGLVPGQELDLGTIRLEPGGVVSGSCSVGSMPAANAVLVVAAQEDLPEIRGARLERGVAWSKAVDRGRSAADGTFRLVGLPCGRFGLWIRHESSWWAATEPFDVRAGEEARIGDVVLEPLPLDHRIEGLVVSPSGAPVEGASVSTSIEDRETRQALRLESRSGPDGRFCLYLLPLPREPLEVRAEVPDRRLADAVMPSVEPGARQVVLRLGVLRELVLRVHDPRGRPVESFGWWGWVERGSESVSELTTEAPRPGGVARITLPEGSAARLTIEARGYEDQDLAVSGSDRELEVILEPATAHRIEGRVTSRRRPVPGAHVDLVLEGGDLLDDLIGRAHDGTYYCTGNDCRTTDEEGVFLVPNDWPAYRYRVRAWAPGHAAVLSEVVQGSAQGLELELTEGGLLAGQVLLPGGKTGSGVALRAYQTPTDSLECSVGREFRTRSDDSGLYRFEHLEPGTWLVSPELAPGELQSLGWSEDDDKVCRETPFVFSVGEGRSTAGDLDLSTARGPCRLLGRLTVGNRIREGYAYLVLEGQQALRIAFSGIERSGGGSFELSTRSAGTYRLVVHAGPGHHQYRLVTDLVTLVPGETSWERSLSEAEWKETGVRLDKP